MCLNTKLVVLSSIMNKTVLTIIISFLTLLVSISFAEEKRTSCQSTILLDPATGEVLFEQDAHTPLPPASMAKLMTAYIVRRRVNEGQVSAGDIVRVSAEVSKIGGSQVYLKEHEEFSITELLEALMIESANDAALALAEHVSGSREGFVDLMNQESQKLKMTETTFFSPHGLPPAKDQKPDLISAHDLALLAQAILKDTPELLELTGKVEAPFRAGAFVMRNHNHLLTSFPGCDGLKTGYYAQAGFGVTATAQKNGARLVAVAMNCPTSKIRDAEVKALLSRGFNQFKLVKLVDRGAVVQSDSPVVGGAVSSSAILAKDEIKVSLREPLASLVEKKVDGCNPINAPAKKDSSCGVLRFVLKGKEIAKTELVLAQDLEKGGMLSSLKGLIGY